MSKRLAIELLQKVNNPSHMFTEEPDDEGVNKFISYKVYIITKKQNKIDTLKCFYWVRRNEFHCITNKFMHFIFVIYN